MKNFIIGFKESVEKYANKIAVVDETRELTYQELNQEANDIAYALRNYGEKVVVAICMDRSVGFISSIIGIFKTGNVYLPIDPEYPETRIRQMIEEAGVTVCITAKEYSSKIRNSSKNVEVLEFESIKKCDEMIKFCELAPKQDAYIIFTSGTTGKPKGAIVNHKGMINHLESKIELLGLTCESKVLETASQCFDISVWQFLVALLVGGEVHVINKEHVRDIFFMNQYIEDNQITILELVPTMFSEILAMVGNDKKSVETLRSLKYILLTGEVLPVTLCHKWYALKQPAILVNAYGPTECSDDVTHYIVPRNIAITEKKVLIGKAIQNTELYVVVGREEDGTIHVADKGEKGELYICGECLGNGYINSPDKTASSFVNIKINGETKKAYRSGDLVSLVDDENYVFGGRIDRQIKLNGYRIEVEEIEEVIRSYENVDDCCVVKRAINNNFVYYLHNDENTREAKEQEFLVAYIVGQDVSTVVLKQWLEERLPFFMVPEQYMCIDEIPTNPNGKIDRTKLPEPNMKRNIENTEYEELETTNERVMASIWSEILNISPIGRKDSFLGLGGDSLTSIQVITRIKDKFNINISYADFTKAKTLESLCLFVEKLQKDNQKNEDNEFEVSSKDNYYETTYGQKGQWFLWRLNKESPFYSFQGLLNVFGETNYEKLNKTINYIVCNNAILRTRFVEKDNDVKQYIENYKYKEYECIDYSDLEIEIAEKKMREISYEIAQTAFDLENEIMIKFNFFYMPGNQYTVVITMHEIIMDAWATRRLIQEFIDAYKKIDVLEIKCDKRYQFHDYAEWEKENVSKESLSKERNYWLENLKGELPILDISMDHPRPQIPTYKGKSQGLTFNAEISKAIKRFCVEENVTLFTVLLAGYYLLLSKYSNQEEVVIGTPYACRNTKQREELYGYFLNMLPLRIHMTGEDSLVNMVHVVQNTLNNGIDNSNYPFIWTVEDLKVARDTSYSPVFQVMFDMLNFPKVNFPIESDISLNFEEIDIGYKKYDLEMYGNEQDGKIYVRISYLTDLFSDSTIEQFLDSYQKIIYQMVNEGNKKIKDTTIIGEKCSEAIRKLDRSKVEPNYKDNDLVKWIQKDLEGKEEKIAYRMGNGEISYSQLLKNISSISLKLTSIGMEEGARVLLYGDKDISYIQLMFTLYQNKITYVPCDLLRPIQSIYEIARDLEIEYIISSVEICDSNYTKVEECERLGIYKNQNKYTKKEIAACIILTSGSSGKEKYVEINRDSFSNRIFSQIEDYPLNEDDVIGSLRSCSLVTHIFEIYIGLVTKNTTVMLSRLDVLDEDYLLNALGDNNISYLTLSPSILSLIINAKNRKNYSLNAIRVVFSGSDKLDSVLIDRFYENFPMASLYNTYGTTETTSTILIQKMATDGSIVEDKPIKGAKIEVLDPYGNPQPFGVEGDVAVSGILLSNGYVLRNNDFENSKIKGRHYFTNDRGFIGFDGKFHLVGRKDRTIKSRGYRINMAEIETRVKMCNQVESVSCVFYEKNGTQEYSIFYTAKEKNLEEEIRNVLQEKYPLYMMPDKVVNVEQIPKTRNGKIKYSDLSDMLEVTKADYVAEEESYTKTEAAIKEIFSEVLGMTNIQKDKGFFELGGHSLTAVALCAEVLDRLDFELEITDLYGGIVTIKDIASYIDDSM